MALVSVIIPTTGRPKLVLRALASVLGQTHGEAEVIVVVDGPNPETIAALGGIADPRTTRTGRTPESIGPGPARNIGAAQARGEWIAFLDDDDEWMPQKLEIQLAGASVDESTMLSCRCRVLTAHAAYEWPRQIYDGSAPVDEYLWGRRSLCRGEAEPLATASYLMPRRLFATAGFGTTRHNEDDTLLLRLTKQLGARIRMLPQVLVVIHAEDPEPVARGQFRLATRPWPGSTAWARWSRRAPTAASAS